MSSLSLTGFGEGEVLPATASSVTRALARALARYLGGTPFVLGGYSSGGVLAHELTRFLGADRVRPEAVVCVDTYPVDAGPGSLPSRVRRRRSPRRDPDGGAGHPSAGAAEHVGESPSRLADTDIVRGCVEDITTRVGAVPRGPVVSDGSVR